MIQRCAVAILTILAFVLLGASPMMADSGHRAHSRVEITQNGDLTASGATSQGHGVLTRNKYGMRIYGELPGLTPGNVFSVWWIVFDAGVEVPFVANATGGIANDDGVLIFAAALPNGSHPASERNPRNVFLAGVSNEPLTSFVLIHVLDHGVVIPGGISKQLSTVDFGCPAPACPLQTEFLFSGL